jgi:hypothetical protein
MIGGLALAAAPLFAQGPAPAPCGPCCGKPECATVEAKVLASRLVETRVPTCEYETHRIWKPEIKEVQGCKWVDTDVCQEIEEDVTCTKMVEVSVTDPCTGCVKTEYQPQTCVEKKKRLIIQIIPVKKEYHYKVLTFKPEDIDVPKTAPTYQCQAPAPLTTKISCGDCGAPACRK